MMKLLTAFLVVLLGVTQYSLWFSKTGVREYLSLKHQIESQQQKNQTISLENSSLSNEIQHLKQDKSSIESHARTDLGMIKEGETFYQVIPHSKNTLHQTL